MEIVSQTVIHPAKNRRTDMRAIRAEKISGQAMSSLSIIAEVK